MDVLAVWPWWLAGLGSASLLLAAWLWRQRRVAAARKGSRVASATRGAGLRAKTRPGTDTEALDTLADWAPVATRVLTSAEREACHVLRKALPEHMVLAQVPLARFIKVPTDNPYGEWLKRVGSLCADLVVCDMASQVVAVVEVRQPASRENERTRARHARMDRVLAAAGIPVHIWLEGALPGPVIAREAILDAAVHARGRAGFPDAQKARRDVAAAAMVASMQAPWQDRDDMQQGLSVDERSIDVVIDEAMDEWQAAGGADNERKEPPPSTWFDDMDSGRVPLEPRAFERVS